MATNKNKGFRLIMLGMGPRVAQPLWTVHIEHKIYGDINKEK